VANAAHARVPPRRLEHPGGSAARGRRAAWCRSWTWPRPVPPATTVRSPGIAACARRQARGP